MDTNDTNKRWWAGKYDRVFKSVIADEDNPKMLEEFLSSVLNMKIDNIIHLRTELPVSNVIERTKTLDLLVESNGKFIHLELNINKPTYLHTRNLCFFMDAYVKKTRRGKKYDISSLFVHIDLTYGLSDDYDVVEVYEIKSEKHKYVENVKIIEFNMDKITDFWYHRDMEMVEKYKPLVLLGLDKENLDLITSTISKGDDFVAEFTDKVKHLNEDEQFQSLMTYEEDLMMCQNTDKEIAFNDGLEQGLEQGKQEGIDDAKREIVKNLLNENMDLNLISKVTGLTCEEIENLGE